LHSNIEIHRIASGKSLICEFRLMWLAQNMFHRRLFL